MGGCSNALILYQLYVGLKFNPDFIIFSFTDNSRYEVDNNVNAIPDFMEEESIAHFLKSRYLTNMWRENVDSVKLNVIDKWRTVVASNNFENIKNYFYITQCLLMADRLNIPFCYSLGGFSNDVNYQEEIINGNFMINFLQEFTNKELSINLWSYPHGKPYFHVEDKKVHQLFASECMRLINCERI